MQKNKKNVWFKFVGVFSIISMLSVMIFPSLSMAASVTSAKATFGRLEASTAASSVIVEFVTPTGIQTGGADTITLTFSADFTLAAESATNFDIGLGDSGTCSTATYTDETIVTTGASATEWNVDVTGQVMTFSPETDDTLTAGFCIRFEMGTAATTGGTGSASTVTNGAVDDDDSITIGGAFGDSGTLDIPIVDDDTVAVTASVNSSLTFDLDTAAGGGDGESATPYAVDLGTIATSSVRVSGSTDSIQMIVLEADTNSSGGVVVTVRNTNGANGLVSTSVPADNIGSADGTMAAGTENYGVCVDDDGADLSGFTISTGFSGDACDADSETNVIEGLSTTAANIVETTGPVSAAHAEVIVNAAVSGITSAHTDYTDAITFIATATY